MTIAWIYRNIKFDSHVNKFHKIRTSRFRGAGPYFLKALYKFKIAANTAVFINTMQK
jgi:hypothetical protein